METRPKIDEALRGLIPEKQLGLLFPVGVMDTTPYEFYSMVPGGIMLVAIALGLKEFSHDDLERVMKPFESHFETFKDRGVDLVVHAGVPFSLMLGPARHAHLLEQLESRTGIRIISTLQCVLAAVRSLGVKRLTVVNKWDAGMNNVLTNYFEENGIASQSTCSLSMAPAEFLKLKNCDGTALAYQLAHEALTSDPAADGLYIGGGSWLTAPLVSVLESEFKRPVVTNTTAFVWRACQMLSHTGPINGYGCLFRSQS